MKILVSIICNVYNHKKYLRETLEGFLSQKCSFQFEVLIHDDCSTDGSADIIKEYAEKYPEMILPIYQEENQHSKGVAINAVYQYPRVRGKYTAYCEGDDFWCDPEKLQRQVDALESSPEADICTHGAVRIRDGKKAGGICPANKRRVFTPFEVILGGGEFVATNSIMCRSELNRNIPDFRKVFFFDIDYALQIHGSLRGGMIYLPECMSAYREFAAGSWTVDQYENPEKRDLFRERYEEMLRTLDNDTGGTYSAEIGRKLKESEYYSYSYSCQFKKMLAPEFVDIRRSLPLKTRLILRCKAMFPGAVLGLRRRKVRGGGGEK